MELLGQELFVVPSLDGQVFVIVSRYITVEPPVLDDVVVGVA